MYFEPTAQSTEIFQSGQFQCNFYEEARELLKLTDEIFGRYTFSKDRYLIGAVKKIKEAGICDFEVLKRKISSAPNLMDSCTNIKNYCYAIERVYNHGNTTRKVII
jgi:hypothetical protein